MIGTLKREYHKGRSPTLLILFDLRDPAAVERLHRERAGWQADSDIEALDEEHFVLLVYASEARRAA